jgi:hypothetical protein
VGGLESETKKDGEKILGESEKKAKVGKLPIGKRRMTNPAIRHSLFGG